MLGVGSNQKIRNEMLARTAFWFIDPKRKDPVLAEMELNELVWTEFRPEMTRVGAFLGSAAATQPELSEPVDDLKRS